MRRTAFFVWPLLVRRTDLTGGVKPFSALGKTSSLSLDRRKPVQRQALPGGGRRINAGWCVAVLVSAADVSGAIGVSLVGVL